jgi:cytochrome c biogenesis protein CcmG, thiol:disulfide interchange protein DsbE
VSGHRVRWIAVAVAGVVTVLAVVLALQLGDDERQTNPRSELLGKAAPNFELVAADGSPITLADLAGKAVIVNFWNSWCPPCKDEEPFLQEFYAQHADDPDFAMVGIIRDDPEAEARSYASETGLDWMIAADPDGQAALDFGTRGQPETFAISPDGIVAANQIGPVGGVDDLETMLGAARGVPS